MSHLRNMHVLYNDMYIGHDVATLVTLGGTSLSQLDMIASSCSLYQAFAGGRRRGGTQQKT